MHSCAVVSGVVYCWGGNGSGQLGDGTTTARLSADATRSALSLTGIEAIATGYDHVCAYASGNVWCWGNNGDGEIARDPVEVPYNRAPLLVSGL